jgi:hypothetical protein
VVGYHEVDAGTDDLSIALAAGGDVPVPVPSLMRTQLTLDGRFMPTLGPTVSTRAVRRCAFKVCVL